MRPRGTKCAIKRWGVDAASTLRGAEGGCVWLMLRFIESGESTGGIL